MTDPLPSFEVAYDPAARLLRWTMRVFWTMADVAAFAGAMRAAIQPLGPPPHRYDGLCDSRDFPVQSGEVSAAFERTDGPSRQGRVAIVVGSAMNKLQAQRVLQIPTLRIFLSLEEAEARLRDGAADPS